LIPTVAAPESTVGLVRDGYTFPPKPRDGFRIQDVMPA
jgi:hypothetical protein